MKRFKKGPSPAMIVAMVALVVAMGGSAYAGVKIGTKQIKDKAVTSKKTDRMWALVTSDGTVVKQSGGISLASKFTGGYYLVFPKSLLGRSLLATPSATSGVSVAASICGGVNTQQIPCFAGPNSSSSAYVAVSDDTGTLTDERFYIQAW